MLSAINRNHCPQSIGNPVRNRRNPQAGQQLENTVENPALRPSAETLMDRFPVAETLGQIPPGTSSPKAVENRFDEQSIIFGGAAHVSFTPRQNVLDPLPLVVAQSKTLHRPAPPRADHP